MSGASETFAITLARASRQAMRFLRSRGLARSDRDDVIAAAMLWCWENRDNYSLTATLEQWFMGAVKNAYRDYRRGELRQGATEIVENMGAKDSPEYNVVLRDAVETLAKNMDEVDRAIVQLTLDGKSQREAATTLSIDIVTLKRRLWKMRDQLPASAHVNTILRRAVAPPKPNLDEYDTQSPQRASGIDRDIEALDFPPPAGKECPPCWRCKWFEGYLPGPRKEVRMEIVERSIKAAVLWTERRKQRIAQEVRDGNL